MTISTVEKRRYDGITIYTKTSDVDYKKEDKKLAY